ncbi:MAG: CCA tRNA nucleotidyltransferase [Cyanobacteria bacterium P01_A01_bin.114]
MASALSPKTWPFSLDWLPEAAHLVGGSVRDALLHRQADYLDLDFVLPQGAISLASTIAKHYHVGFVVLDAENQIARAVFEDATIDFAQQVGPTLETDLQRRDFTINAIAYHPQTNALIDPLNGIEDLKHQTLRMVSSENLAEDPLRLLRAYRQAAQLTFTIDSETRAAIRRLAPCLKQVAAERVRHEIDALLSQPHGVKCLRLAWQDGVFDIWLPHLSESQVNQLAAVDQALNTFHQKSDYLPLLQGWKAAVPPGHYRSWVKIAKLAQILPPEAAQAEAQLTRLKYSRSESQATLKIFQAQPYLTKLAEGTGSRCDRFFFFKTVGTSFPAAALVGLAQGIAWEVIDSLIGQYLTPEDPIAHPQALLTGRDLMQHLQLKPGPHIGELLKAVELAQAKGHIDSAEAALCWVKSKANQLDFLRKDPQE